MKEVERQEKIALGKRSYMVLHFEPRVKRHSDGSRMDKEDDNGTLENGEHTLEHLLRTKGVTKPHGKRTATRS